MKPPKKQTTLTLRLHPPTSAPPKKTTPTSNVSPHPFCATGAQRTKTATAPPDTPARATRHLPNTPPTKRHQGPPAPSMLVLRQHCLGEPKAALPFAPTLLVLLDPTQTTQVLRQHQKLHYIKCPFWYCRSYLCCLCWPSAPRARARKLAPPLAAPVDRATLHSAHHPRSLRCGVATVYTDTTPHSCSLRQDAPRFVPPPSCRATSPRFCSASLRKTAARHALQSGRWARPCACPKKKWPFLRQHQFVC